MKNNPSINDEKKISTKKLGWTLAIIFILILLIFTSVFNTINSDRRLPSLHTSNKELAVRGDILSRDNFKISTSKKVYKATIDTRCLDLDKKDFFIKMFSIYSNINEQKIRKKIDKSLSTKKYGRLVLSYNIDSRTAKNLKTLAFKLRRLNVFKPTIIYGSRIIIGLDVKESGEKRVFPYENSLTPLIGYLSKYESKSSKTKVKGVKGLENKYNQQLNNTQDGILKGERDVSSKISFNKKSIITQREDGANLVLNIPLKLQKNIELTLDFYKEKLGAKEIIASVMDSETGKVLALASSNRFNPQNIKQVDVDNGYLQVNAIEYQFEPGSIVKPIAISLAMNHGLVKSNEIFDAHNKGPKNKKGEYKKGAYKIGRYTIHDDHQFTTKKISLDDIVIFSSNIGTLKIAQRLSADQFYEGYKKFGLSVKTGIDLPYEKSGIIHKLYQYRAGEKDGKDNIFKATDSYGQGITATFMQMMKAYTTFNNNGIMVTPQIVSHMEQDDKIKEMIEPEKIEVIKPQVANEMKRMLIKTVNEGTGTKAKIDQFEIGGKTGTANIAENGRYQRKYISSFFGFVNGEKKKYTIGVTVREPISRGKYWYYYYASHSAVPVFKEIVSTLVKLKYLKPKFNPKENIN